MLVGVDREVECASCDLCAVTGVELSAAPRRPQEFQRHAPSLAPQPVLCLFRRRLCVPWPRSLVPDPRVGKIQPYSHSRTEKRVTELQAMTLGQACLS